MHTLPLEFPLRQSLSLNTERLFFCFSSFSSLTQGPAFPSKFHSKLGLSWSFQATVVIFSPEPFQYLCLQTLIRNLFLGG